MDHYMKNFLTGQAITLQQMTSSDLEAFVKIEGEKKSLLFANDEIPFPKPMRIILHSSKVLVQRKKIFSLAYLKNLQMSLLVHVPFFQLIGKTVHAL